MSEIIKNRTVRPSTRLRSSSNYKVSTKGIYRGDILVVNINHESKSFFKTYRFNGADVADKDSISFNVSDLGAKIEVFWSGAEPINSSFQTDKLKKINNTDEKESVDSSNSTFLKKSFEPISTAETNVLILGTMPGDKSLELEEYYGHPRNRFWKILSNKTATELPITYTDKKNFLFKTNIGVWDVVHIGNRIGSLDNAIKDEVPNDLNNFIIQHKNLKVIAFNGKRSEVLYNKYFDRKDELKYISLPSTSPANAGIDFVKMCDIWQQILIE